MKTMADQVQDVCENAVLQNSQSPVVPENVDSHLEMLEGQHPTLSSSVSDPSTESQITRAVTPNTDSNGPSSTTNMPLPVANANSNSPSFDTNTNSNVSTGNSLLPTSTRSITPNTDRGSPFSSTGSSVSSDSPAPPMTTPAPTVSFQQGFTGQLGAPQYQAPPYPQQMNAFPQQQQQQAMPTASMFSQMQNPEFMAMMQNMFMQQMQPIHQQMQQLQPIQHQVQPTYSPSVSTPQFREYNNPSSTLGYERQQIQQKSSIAPSDIDGSNSNSDSSTATAPGSSQKRRHGYKRKSVEADRPTAVHSENANFGFPKQMRHTEPSTSSTTTNPNMQPHQSNQQYQNFANKFQPQPHIQQQQSFMQSANFPMQQQQHTPQFVQQFIPNNNNHHQTFQQNPNVQTILPTFSVSTNAVDTLNATSSTGARQDGLPIDTSPTVHTIESTFLRQFEELVPYSYNENDLRTVVFSRILQKKFYWPLDKPITISNLKPYFSISGHTMSIDNSLSYSRLLAFDLDCVCRKEKFTSKHLEYDICKNFVEIMLKLLKDAFHITRLPRIDLWHTTEDRRCSFHIYTDLMVSMPTHLQLLRLLTSQFHSSPVKIEVPMYMPLPYSAKNENRPYQFVSENREFSGVALTAYGDCEFFELYELSRTKVQEETIAIIHKMDDTLLYLTRRPVGTRLIHNKLALIDVESIEKLPGFDDMQQLHTFIENAITCNKVALAKATKNTTGAALTEVDLSAFSEKQKKITLKFFALFNEKFRCRNPASIYDLFLDVCTTHGTYDLQHYCCALFKFVKPAFPFDEFRALMRCVFASKMSDLRSVQQFVDTVQEKDFGAYQFTCVDILSHLYYLKKNNVTPLMTFHEKINTIMKNLTGVGSPEEQAEIIANLPKDQKEAEIKKVLELYLEVMIELECIAKDGTNDRYNYRDLRRGTHYVSSPEKPNEFFLPHIIFDWVGFRNTSKVNTFFKSNAYRCAVYSYVQPNFVSLNFLFATYAGVFNSSTGLYSSSNKLLKFNKSRTSSIWPVSVWTERITLNIDSRVNEILLERLDVAKVYAKFMHTHVSKLYIYFIVIPAIIQMRGMMSIAESRISQLMSKIYSLPDLDPMMVLFEYLEFDMKHVYVFCAILKKYGGVSSFFSYKKLCVSMFNTVHITQSQWSRCLQQLMDECDYNENLPTYKERLLSLRGPSMEIDTQDHEFIIVVILMAVIVKCPTFSAFTNVLKLKMPAVSEPHPDFADFDHVTCVETMAKNMNRAIDKTFGAEPKTDFEIELINECLSICMSCNFEPETVMGYLDSISATFIPFNMLKKMFVYHGKGGVGKTLMCNKIMHLLGPNLGRFNSFDSSKRLDFGEQSICIFNEIDTVTSSLLKSVTGNDCETAMRFYTQAHVTQLTRPLMYAATNTFIKFSSDVDLAAVDRLYGVFFTGKQVHASSNVGSFFDMFLDASYFMNMITTGVTDPFALSWLAFASFMLRRDKNYCVPLNVESPAAVNYRNTVYYNNNKVYKIMRDCGFTYDANFFINSSKILERVNAYFADSDKGSVTSSTSAHGPITNVKAFQTRFAEFMHVDLVPNLRVDSFQETLLIAHIKEAMATHEEPNNVITEEEITQRLRSYTKWEHRDNAYQYFHFLNSKHFDFKTTTYKGIAFSNESFSYQGNEMEDNSDDLNVPRQPIVSHSMSTNTNVPVYAINQPHATSLVMDSL